MFQDEFLLHDDEEFSTDTEGMEDDGIEEVPEDEIAEEEEDEADEAEDGGEY